jgi:hypothetical protein
MYISVSYVNPCYACIVSISGDKTKFESVSIHRFTNPFPAKQGLKLAMEGANYEDPQIRDSLTGQLKQGLPRSHYSIADFIGYNKNINVIFAIRIIKKS